MKEPRPSRSVMVQAPRVVDAVGSALKNAFGSTTSGGNADWDSLIRRIDVAELNRRC